MKFQECDPCGCGHEFGQHYDDFDSPLCIDCVNDKGKFDKWHKFKLDNLAFIERKAKEQGLV